MAVKRAALPAISREDLAVRLTAAKDSLPRNATLRQAEIRRRLEAKGIVLGGPGGKVDRRERADR